MLMLIGLLVGALAPAVIAQQPADESGVVTGVGTSDDQPATQSPADSSVDANAQPRTPDWLVEAMPEQLVKEEMLGLAYWQWLGLFAAIVVGLMIDLAFRMALRLAIGRFTARRQTEAKHETITRAVRPFGLFASAVFWVTITELNLLLLAPGGVPLMVLNGAAQVFAVLAGAWAMWRLTDLIAEVMLAQAAKTDTKVDDVLVPMVRKAVKIFIIVFGVIYGAQALDIPVGPLVASVGIGSLAFGLAAKDTIENFFGSIAVLLDRPFQVGDWVVIDDTEGIVEEIGFRSTRVRTFYNSLVTVPNATLVRAVVDNYGARKYRRWKTQVGIQYDTPPARIVAFTEGIRELIRTHPYTRKDYFQVYLNDFADSSLNILLYVFHEVPDWSTELRERERLFIDIIRLADKVGVQFAFPTTTVHLYQEEHRPYETRHETPQRMTDRRASVTGIRVAQELVKNQTWVSDKPGPVEFREGPTFVAIDPETGEPIDENQKTQIENRTAGG